jgi:hypothetical protein
MLFPSSFMLFHEFLDQFNIMFEAIMLGDEGVEDMELFHVAGKGGLGLSQL